MSEISFSEGIEKIIRDCTQVKAGEKVVIVTDTAQDPQIASALFAAAVKYGGEPVIVTMLPVTAGGELPATVNEAVKNADVVITPTSTSIYHSPGIKRAYTLPNKARVLALSECTQNTFTAGGMTADFKGIKPYTEKLRDMLTGAKHIKVQTPAGTYIEAELGGRDGYMCAGVADKAGILEALPTIEAYIAPLEKSVNGTIAVDVSCSAGVGLVDEPMIMEVKEGKIISLKGGEAARKLSQKLAATENPNSYQIAEIGIGLNPECRILGNTEDEGHYGTFHIGIGRNTGFGGANDAPVHIDVIQWTPDIYLDGEKIYEDGRFLYMEEHKKA